MRVIDISKHQGTFDPAKAKSAGVEAVIIRLAYGTTADTKALCWAQPIKAQGLKLGGYGFATWHYASVNNGSAAKAAEVMRRQVSEWIALARANGVNWWVAVDQELEKGQAMGLTMLDNTTLLNEACTMIKNAGFEPLIYCSVSWDYTNIHTNSLVPFARYWFAYYGNAVKDKPLSYDVRIGQLPDGKYKNWMAACYSNGRLAGWQYGSVGGLGSLYGCGSVNVDRNVFYLEPETKQVVKLFKVHTGEMTKGDLQAVENILKERLITYEVEQ